MDTELQMIVDSLSERIHRQVAIDDSRFHVLAYSAHEGEIDPVRLASILAHTPSDAVRKWVVEQGIRESVDPVRLEGNVTLEMTARLCVPIRANDVLLGFLWITEGESPLDADELTTANRAAEAAATLLYRQLRRRSEHRDREVSLANQLLSVDPERRSDAARTLIAEGLIRDEVPIFVIVTALEQIPPTPLAGTIDAIVGQAVDQFVRVMTPHNCLTVVREGHGIAFVSADDPALMISGLTNLAGRLLDMLEARAGKELTGWIAGCSDSPRGLTEAIIGYQEAMDSVLVARQVPALGRVVNWADSGPYQLLARLAERSDVGLPESIEKLLALPAERGLTETLECYLDLAGDIKATANALCLHRASLYYRLQKIETVTNRSLKQGDDRLELHLGLKLARLLDVHPAKPK